MNIKNYIENLIITKNLEINTIFDIGGWMGYWTKEMSSGLLKDKEFVIFEANPYYEESLSKLKKKL